MYGHSAGGLIVSLWLDRLRQRGATARSRHRRGLVLNSPWLDLAGPGGPAPGPGDLGDDRRRCRGLRFQGRGPRDRSRAATAPACTGTTTGNSTTTCNGNRWAVFRSPSAGCGIAVRWRGQAHGCIAGSMSGGAQSAPAVGLHRVREDRRRDGHAMRRCGSRRHPDRAVGRLYRQPQHHRSGEGRQARCVLIDALAAADSPTTSWTVWLDRLPQDGPRAPTPRRSAGKR